jgi:hypothetical protein
VPLWAKESVVDRIARGATAGRPSQKLPPTAIYCHFAAANPLRPFQPFQFFFAVRGHAGQPVIGHWLLLVLISRSSFLGRRRLAAVDARRATLPDIRGLRAGGSLVFASSTPATQLLPPVKTLELNHVRYGLRHASRRAHIRLDSSAGGCWPYADSIDIKPRR